MTVKARADVTVADIRDVSSATRYYLLQASTAATPAKPTATPPPSPWTTTEPTYDAGDTSSLYTTDLTVFSDNTFMFSDVSLSTSYEAAKSAANAAVAASKIANDANQSAASAQTAANFALANGLELVVNGGFETGDLTGWKAVNADVAGYDQDNPHSGAWQARLGAGGTLTQTIRGLVSGRTYRCSYWQRGFAGRKSAMTVTFPGGSPITVATLTGVTPYTLVSGDVVVPNGAATMDVHISCDTNYIRFDDVSVKDVTEVEAAQDAANTAQVTADGKNRIFTSISEPSHTGLVAGDTWRQINNTTDRHVTAYKVWNGSAFVPDYMDLDSLAVANSLSAKSANIQSLNAAIAAILKLDVGQLVASDATVDTAVINKLAVGIATVIKLDAGTITTGQLGANRIDVNNLAAKIATILKLDVSNLIASSAVIDSAVIAKIAAQIITASLLQTSAANPRSWIDSTGFHTTDANGNKTFDTTTGQTPLLTGGFQTGLSGNRIVVDDITDDNGISTGGLRMLRDEDELSSLRFIDDVSNSGYLHTGLYNGDNGQYLEFATLLPNSDHQPDPLTYDASFIAAGAQGKMLIDAAKAVNISGTWFARDVSNLPTAPRVVDSGARAMVAGTEYIYDESDGWHSCNDLPSLLTHGQCWSDYQYFMSGGIAGNTCSLSIKMIRQSNDWTTDAWTRAEIFKIPDYLTPLVDDCNIPAVGVPGGLQISTDGSICFRPYEHMTFTQGAFMSGIFSWQFKG